MANTKNVASSQRAHTPAKNAGRRPAPRTGSKKNVKINEATEKNNTKNTNGLNSLNENVQTNELIDEKETANNI